MAHSLDVAAASPWILAIVFVVASLDALLPFMPSESVVLACGVAAAHSGRPHLALLIVVAAAGAWLGDVLSYRIGRRSTAAVTARLSHRRAVAVHDWVHRLLHSRGGLVIMFARYVPGGRSTTALSAGLVGYPSRRFAWFTAAGVLLWSAQASLLGYLGGSFFESRPLLGLAAAWGGALVITGVALLAQRMDSHLRVTSATPHRRVLAIGRGKGDRRADVH